MDLAVPANLRTINGVDEDENDLTLDTPITGDYEVEDLAQVNRYHTITYDYDDALGALTKSVDAGDALRKASMVSSFTFSYEDAAGTDLGFPNPGDPVLNLDEIRKIKIDFTLLDPENAQATISFDTEINLRNMEPTNAE